MYVTPIGMRISGVTIFLIKIFVIRGIGKDMFRGSNISILILLPSTCRKICCTIGFMKFYLNAKGINLGANENCLFLECTRSGYEVFP